MAKIKEYFNEKQEKEWLNDPEYIKALQHFKTMLDKIEKTSSSEENRKNAIKTQTNYLKDVGLKVLKKHNPELYKIKMKNRELDIDPLKILLSKKDYLKLKLNK